MLDKDSEDYLRDFYDKEYYAEKCILAAIIATWTKKEGDYSSWWDGCGKRGNAELRKLNQLYKKTAFIAAKIWKYLQTYVCRHGWLVCHINVLIIEQTIGGIKFLFVWLI